jgi:hypothetical protein
MRNNFNPFKSERIRDVPPPDEPSLFAAVGGWGAAAEAAAARRLDPDESEREQRVAGALALADLAKRDAERQKAAMDERLRGVQRGRDYRGRP